ncbi:MAG TPA: hypothetical protein VFM68_03695 [Candidatus Saccharimonadales bacterium]|nr:hypothetical protein [Candidatus Saccharimonadales bacterium]
MQRVYYSAKGLLKVINNLDGTLKHFELPPDAVRIEARKKRANTKGAAIDNHRLTAEENKILNMFTEDIKNLSTEEVDKLRESESNFDSSDTDTE